MLIGPIGHRTKNELDGGHGLEMKLKTGVYMGLELMGQDVGLGLKLGKRLGMISVGHLAGDGHGNMTDDLGWRCTFKCFPNHNLIKCPMSSSISNPIPAPFSAQAPPPAPFPASIPSTLPVYHLLSINLQ